MCLCDLSGFIHLRVCVCSLVCACASRSGLLICGYDDPVSPPPSAVGRQGDTSLSFLNQNVGCWQRLIYLECTHTHTHVHTTLKMSTQIQTFHSGQCFCGFLKECSKQMGFLSMFLSPPSLAPLHTWNRHTGNFNANSCKLIPSCFVIIHAGWNACTSLCSEFSLRLWFLSLNCNTTEHWSFCFSISPSSSHSHNQNAWPNAHPLLCRNKI